MSAADLLHHEQTGEIIRCAIEVQRVLGVGLVERAYQNALARELAEVGGVRVSLERSFQVLYRGVVVAAQRIDLLVEMGGVLIVVECKHFRGDESRPRALAVLGSYVNVAAARLGLLLNFGARPLGASRVLPHRRLGCGDE